MENKNYNSFEKASNQESVPSFEDIPAHLQEKLLFDFPNFHTFDNNFKETLIYMAISEDNKEENSPSEERREEELSSIELELIPERVKQLEVFIKEINPRRDLVYYPCCGSDISISTAFPNSRVIHVDIEGEKIELLKRNGIEAHNVSALDFEVEEVDVLVMLNPGISSEVPSSHVSEDGFILCNNYHKTASVLNSQEEYEFIGFINEGSKGKSEIKLDRENLQDYWKQVETDEEFKNTPFYEIAFNVVRKITGKEENILEEYKIIIRDAMDQSQKRYEESIKNKPELEGYLEKPEEETVLRYDYNGESYTIIPQIPKKKGSADGIFVFKKRKQ